MPKLVLSQPGRRVLAGPAHGHHSTGFVYGGDSPLRTHVSNQLPQKGHTHRELTNHSGHFMDDTPIPSDGHTEPVFMNGLMY